MIGANLVRQLVLQGARPLLLTRPASSLLRLCGIEDEVMFVQGDLTDTVSIQAAVNEFQPDIVFHLASTFFNPPTLSPDTHMRVNVLGTQNLLEALKETSDVKVIFAGSASVYQGGGQLREDDPLAPTTIFGASKAACTILGHTYAKLYGIKFIELRFFTPFGPWERAARLIPHTILSALSGKDVCIGHGGQQRDFTYIDDAVEAMLLAGVRPVKPGMVLNISSGVARPIRDVVELVLELMGNPVSLKTGARPTRQDEIWEVSGDASVASKYLDWKPRVSFEDGLKKSIEWFKANRFLAEQLT